MRSFMTEIIFWCTVSLKLGGGYGGVIFFPNGNSIVIECKNLVSDLDS